MPHSDHLAGRSVGQLTPVDISALIHPSAVDSAQGMTGFVAVGNVAWLRAVGNQQDKGEAESPDWIISTQPGAAGCAFQAWAEAISHEVGVQPLQAFPIFGKHARELSAADVVLLQQYAAGNGYNAIEIGVDADCFVNGIFFVDADLDVLENGRYGCIVIGREVDPLAAWTVLIVKALDTSQGKG